MTSDQDAADIVRAGYDRMGDRYTAIANGTLTAGRRHALAAITEYVPLGGRVLDLGCGAGLPMTVLLAERWQIHGIDISGEQIARARGHVPSATFEVAGIGEFIAAAGTYDAVVAFYSLIHVPRDEHAAVVRRIAEWLRPGGLFIASFGVHDDPGTIESDWLGVPMFFSHFDQKATVALIEAAGLEVVSATIIDEPEHDGTASFLWVVARRRD